MTMTNEEKTAAVLAAIREGKPYPDEMHDYEAWKIEQTLERIGAVRYDADGELVAVR